MTQIDDTLFELEPKQPKGRKAKKKEPRPSDDLLSALHFVALAQVKKSTRLQERFCVISNGWACACNGTLMIAAPVQIDLDCAPLTFVLIDALNQTKTELSITKQSEKVIIVKSENIEVSVDCAPEYPRLIAPDEFLISADDKFLAALHSVMWLADEKSKNTEFASVRVTDRTVSTLSKDGDTAECEHDINIQPNFIKALPKVSALAIVKCKKSLIGLGYSTDSITFFFNDGSFIKSACFETIPF